MTTARTSFAIILAVGVAVREVFSFWTGHPFDFELWVRTGFSVAHGVSPYGVLGPVPGLSFASDFSPSAQPTVGYLPFWPLLLGGVYDLYTVIGGGDRFVYYFLLKQPEIAGDVLLGYFISRGVRAVRPEFANEALALWLFSPLTIIVSGVWGMFDSLAMLPVVAALETKRESVRPALEGLAVWIKSIPLIFAVPVAFYGQKKLTSLALAVAVPVVGTVVPLLVFGWPLDSAFSTLNSTVTKGGQSLSAVGFVFYLIESNTIATVSPAAMKATGYLWVPAELIATYLGYRWYGFRTKAGLVQSMLLCAVAFMLFKAQVNEQYGVYVLALGLVDLAWNPSRKWLYASLTAADVTYLLVNNVLLVRFLAPIYPGWSSTETLLAEMMGPWQLRLEFACAMAFTALNVVYFVLIYRARRRPGAG